MPTAPRVAKLSGTITWSDGSNFNGFAVIGLVFPTSGGNNWPALTIEPNSPKQEIPQWTAVPIVDGSFNNQIGLWYNTDIDPPNTKYAIWYLDAAYKYVGSPTNSSDFFQVTADPTAPPTYTLTVPIAGTTVPTPGDIP